jgi:hypothetical protein
VRLLSSFGGKGTGQHVKSVENRLRARITLRNITKSNIASLEAVRQKSRGKHSICRFVLPFSVSSAVGRLASLINRYVDLRNMHQNFSSTGKAYIRVFLLGGS